MSQTNLLVAQSGGPTAAINASLSGVIRRALELDGISHVYGALNGISGLLEGKIIDIGSQIRREEDLSLLASTPAMALGSCRQRLPDPEEDDTPYRSAAAIFDRLGIGCFFYIGGNDSMDTALKLSRYFTNIGSDIRVIGIPKTIDNDLPVTDHTPGYGSAAKFVATALTEIINDCRIYTVPAVTIVEAMGRHAGWLTAAAAVPSHFGFSAPDLVYLPEIPFDIAAFLIDVREKLKQHHTVVVTVSEGIKTKDGAFVCSLRCSSKHDAFGHLQLSGAAEYLEQLVKQEIGCKTRSVELNVLQRCASHAASRCDLDEAARIGSDAVDFALGGATGQAAVFTRVSDEPYLVRTDLCDLAKLANLEKTFPLEWIDEKNHFIREEGIRYILPLIRGSVQPAGNGYLPTFFTFDTSEYV